MFYFDIESKFYQYSIFLFLSSLNKSGYYNKIIFYFVTFKQVVNY